MKKLAIFGLFMALFLCSGTAFAATGVAASAAGRLLDALLQVVVPVASVFAAWLAHRLVSVFEAKTKITVPAQVEAMLDGWADKGIHLAEEKASQALANKADALKGPEKLELAANFVMDLADKYNLTDVARDKVEQLIEAKLNMKRSA